MNYIANRTAFAISNGETFLSEKEERDQLRLAILQTINFIIKKYHGVENFVFCFDSRTKSWRFSLERGESYKETRKEKRDTEPRFSRQGFLQFIDEFYDFLESNNYCTLRYDKAEGDDLIYIASSIIFQSGRNVVVCTADSDMRQLVKFDGKNYIVMFNMDSSKMIHYTDFRTTSNTETTLDDILGISESVIEDGNRAVIESRSEKICPEEALFVKVLSGDKSDNIPSVFRYKKGKSEFSFTDLRAKKVFEKHYKEGVYNGNLTIREIFQDEHLPRYIMEEVQKEPEYEREDEVRKNIDTNRRYIELHFGSYDEDYYACVEDYVLKNLLRPPYARTFDVFLEEEEQRWR